MNRSLVDMVRRICRRSPFEGALKQSLKLICKLNPALDTSDLPDYGVSFSHLRNDNLAELLDELPTETTRAERRFLHLYFSTLWSGQGDVLEIGPFLGGSTRAIALGMLENWQRSAAGRLYTYDRFKHYYKRAALTETLQPLVARGLLSAEDIAALGESATFLEIFHRLHSSQAYFQLLQTVNESLPTTPAESREAGTWFTLPSGRQFSAVFVDGCKSWYATKYFMRQLAQATGEGTAFFFQDYAHYTCFWIPSLIYLLADYFEPLMYIDTTYLFSLKKQLTPAVIDERFPDEPSELGADRFREMFAVLGREAVRRRDSACEVVYRLHLAAALAYLGDKDSARQLIAETAAMPGATRFRRQIKLALRSPTYLPDGTQIIL